MKNKTFIIAEAGANHDRDFDQAKKLIQVAAESKSDAVKFQTYSSDTMYSKFTPDFAGYKNVPELIKSLELPRNWQKDLKLCCEDNGIEFMSTPFDERAVDELYYLGVKRYKIAGFESTDPRFVRYVAATGLPIVISVGIGTDLDVVKDIYQWIASEKDASPDVTFLHCNHSYPTPHEDINLGTMKDLQHFFSNKKDRYENVKVGLSDHTEGILVPPIAVTHGAEVIEKHYTLDRTLPGPDHPFAIEPGELQNMVKNIRLAETTMGTRSGDSPSENNFTMARRSVIIKGEVRKGDTITVDNITTKRPMLENSVMALDYYKVLGKKFTRDMQDDMIMLEEDWK